MYRGFKLLRKPMIKNLSIFFISIVLLIRCSESKRSTETTGFDSTSFQIKYAQGFKVIYKGTYKLLEVTYPFQDAKSGYPYLLVQKGKPIPVHDSKTTVITIPIASIVCTSTTHIPLLDYLGETDKLLGFPTTDTHYM